MDIEHMEARTAAGLNHPNVCVVYAVDTGEVAPMIVMEYVEGQSLSAQHQPDAAADCFAPAAEIEERLSAHCAARGLKEKSRVHLFSAASCWARAGDFHTAIGLGDQLLAQPDLTPHLRQRIEEFTQTLRQRRTQWAAGLVLTASAE